MKAEIIAVGTELLLGQVVNTNAAFLSQELATVGFEVYYHTVVGDNPKRLATLLKEAETRSQLIVLCGGLGPTDDDLTKEIVAQHLDEQLVIDPQAMEKIERYITRNGRMMTENNRRQALSITNGRVVENPNGLAVGSFYEKDNHAYLLLPGPPSELKPMFRQQALPLLTNLLPQTEQLTSRVLRFFGIGESKLVTDLADIIESQTNPTIAPYAKANEVTLRLTVKAANPVVAGEQLDDLEKRVLARVGEYFYGYGDENSLANETVKLLAATGQTVVAAESLTAGLFQSALGAIPGVSEVFLGGFVTYSAVSKTELLGVPAALIDQYGTVSKECAETMARNAQKNLGADYSLAFTGVAGPSEVEGHPVGTVWISLATKSGEVISAPYLFGRNRTAIQHSAVMAGLDLLRKEVLKEISQ